MGRCSKLKDKYYRHAVDNTLCHNLVCWFIIIFMSGVVNVVYPPLYPGDGSQVEFVDPYAVAKINFDGKKYAQDLYQADAVAAALTESSSFVFVYDTADGTDIFTPANIQRMCQMEQFLFEEAELPPSCDTDTDNQTCVHNRLGFPSAGSSIASIFYAFNGSDPSTDWNPAGIKPFPTVGVQPLGLAGFNASDCYLLPQSDVDAVKSRIFAALSPPGGLLRQLYGFFLNAQSETLGFSTSARTTLSYSVGVDADVSVNDIAVRVQQKMFDFLDMEASFQRSAYRDNAQIDNVKVQFFELSLILTEFGSIIQTDFFMVFGSMTFVFFWMWVYTRSLIVTVPCVMAIFFSVTVSMAVYKLVFQIEYFDFIHILAVFLILGIGADDVFVVFDAWNQSKLHHKTEYQRFKYTVDRATQSVFNTSFTTAAAFTVTGVTPLVPISTFGIFAALTIIVCFVFTMTLFPTTVLLWERGCCNCRKEDKATTSQAEDEEEERKLEVTKIKLEDLVTWKNWPLYKYYIPFVRKYDKYIVLVGLCVGAFGVYGITNVSPLTKPEEFLPKDHMLQVFSDTFGDKWLTGSDSEYIALDVYWGVKDIERNFLGWYTGNESRYGDKLIFDLDFDLSDPAAQTAIIDYCNTLTNATCFAPGCQGFGRLILPTSTPVCTIVGFQAWWTSTQGNTDFLVPNKNESQRAQFFSLLATYRDEQNLDEYIGFVDGELRYFGTSWVLTANPISPASVKKPIENALQRLSDEYEETAPATAKNIRFSSREFVQNAVEEALAATVVRGLAITFPIVFLVLLFATNNYILAAFACASIAFIVLVVLGIVFTILGWELGIAESIVAIMIVGLSVDYTVHLGHMYTFAGNHEGFETRSERFEYAILTMGTTVIAGGSTTLGAGLFLFGAQITFFAKMAILLTLTVTFSLYYSFFFMMPLTSWIGPEGDYAKFRGVKKDKLVDAKEIESIQAPL